MPVVDEVGRLRIIPVTPMFKNPTTEVGLT